MKRRKSSAALHGQIGFVLYYVRDRVEASRGISAPHIRKAKQRAIFRRVTSTFEQLRCSLDNLFARDCPDEFSPRTYYGGTPHRYGSASGIEGGGPYRPIPPTGWGLSDLRGWRYPPMPLSSHVIVAGYLKASRQILRETFQNSINECLLCTIIDTHLKLERELHRLMVELDDIAAAQLDGWDKDAAHAYFPRELEHGLLPNLKTHARQTYDGDLDGSPGLIPAQRAAMVAEIHRIDGDDPADLEHESDVYVSGLYLGALRRDARMEAKSKQKPNEKPT